MTDVAVLVPVLNRPHRVAPLVESFLATTPAATRLLFVLQDGDDQEESAVRAGAPGRRYRPDFIIRPSDRTTYPQKINDGFAALSEEIIVCAADDVDFTPGWLDALLAAVRPGVGVIGTRDGGVNPRVAAGMHSVHSAVVRDYIDEHGGSDTPGEVFHEGYRHTFCDDELVTTARARHAFAMSDAVLTHLHPYAKTAKMDSTYRLGMASIAQDRALWTRRRRRLFTEQVVTESRRRRLVARP